MGAYPAGACYSFETRASVYNCYLEVSQFKDMFSLAWAVFVEACGGAEPFAANGLARASFRPSTRDWAPTHFNHIA